MSEDKKPFTVADRRRFTPEGELKDPALHEPSDPRAQPAGEPTPPRVERPPRVQASRTEPAAGEPADFGNFLMQLGAQASLLLGIGGPSGRAAAAADIEGARSIISILEMLRDKTEGRRTPEEDRILEGILYELRMGYLARTGAGGA